jgi:GAF domain-containing protein
LRERHRATLDARRAHVAALSEASPCNFQHQHLLLSAEIARIEGRHGEARELYDQAIESARLNEFTHIEAIACELTGKYYIDRRNERLAGVYLSTAHESYVRWGAMAKANALAEQWPWLGKHSAHTEGQPADPQGGAAGLDAIAVVRAAQAIAGEFDLDQLLDRLLRTVLEAGGADRGALILANQDELRVEAIMTVDPDTSRVALSLPLASSSEVATSIIHYVARTRQPVVLDDAARDERFAADPYLRASATRSLLCVSLVQKDRLVGVLHLENRRAPNAFSPQHIEVLKALSSQAAIALQNASLLSETRRQTEQLRAMNERLERELMERSRAEEERLRIEVERTGLQQAIIEMQRARLAELSTPLIPISDDIMVMPLIGTMDAGRAEEMLRVALDGTQMRSAKTVILDITGVKVVDTQVAATLLRTVEALRLLGAETVITGVRGDVAQELIRLDIDFPAKVKTKGTLQAGINHALGTAFGRRGAAR